MQKYFEKIIERLERERDIHQNAYDVSTWAPNKIGFASYVSACKEAIRIVNQVAEEYKDKYVSIGAYNQVAWERDIAIKQLHDLGYEFGQKIDNNDVIVSNLAKAYAVNIKRYGVDVTEKWATATQNAAALNQAYLRGKQDERDKLDEWREEYNKEHNKEHNKEYNTDAPDINVGSNDGWIPCSDRLPEESGKYTVCTAKGSVYCAKFTVGKKDKFFHTDMYTHIIAWQPLPAPYQPKGEG